MKRDQHNIIIQTDWTRPRYADGGDSAFTTGMMGLTGSIVDIDIMHHFIIGGKLVRHPYQEKNNKPKDTSRDQVIAFFRGLYSANERNIPMFGKHKVTQSCLFYARSWFVNKDILLPFHRVYLYKCAGVTPPIHLTILAYLLLPLDLIWNTKIKPDHEMNQTICMYSVFGKTLMKALNSLHPNLRKNLHDYYCGWRDKCEIWDRISITLRGYDV